jgi:hypothetical protein
VLNINKFFIVVLLSNMKLEIKNMPIWRLVAAILSAPVGLMIYRKFYPREIDYDVDDE